MEKANVISKLSGWYFGKEAEIYDTKRSSDIRDREVFAREVSIVQNYVQNAPKGPLLDIACGTGRVFPYYGNREIHGIDISKDMLQIAQKRVPKAKLSVASATEIPYPDNHFSVAITSRFICHTPEYAQVIREMARVVKPGGSVIIDFFNLHSFTVFPTMTRLWRKKLRHFNLMSYFAIKRIARENNLVIKEVKSKAFFPPRMFSQSMYKHVSRMNTQMAKALPYFSNPMYVRFEKKQ